MLCVSLKLIASRPRSQESFGSEDSPAPFVPGANASLVLSVGSNLAWASTFENNLFIYRPTKFELYDY